MRKEARKVAFKVIFASFFMGEISQNLKNALLKNDKIDEDGEQYVDKILELVGVHSNEFAKEIDERSENFPEARLYPADKSILYVALAEILYMDDIPAKVSANEAANIAAEYSTEKSSSFVSGILAEFIRENE